MKMITGSVTIYINTHEKCPAIFLPLVYVHFCMMMIVIHTDFVKPLQADLFHIWERLHKWIFCKMHL